jgi:hypothetical protein
VPGSRSGIPGAASTGAGITPKPTLPWLPGRSNRARFPLERCAWTPDAHVRLELYFSQRNNLGNLPIRGGAMPRPERPIDPSEGPVQKFATDLRKLRAEAGNPTYRKMADLVFFSKTTLSAAASGNRMPSWEATAAYVAACGGDAEEWISSYQAARKKLCLADETSRRTTPQTFKPGQCNHHPEISCIVASIVPVRFNGPPELVADNADPKRTGCAFDPQVTTLDKVEINTPAGNLLGIAELRYSPSFHVAWGRFVPSERMRYVKNAMVTITAYRPATRTTGTPYITSYDGQAAFGNILLSRLGCVEITITITAPSGGGSATTRCCAR